MSKHSEYVPTAFSKVNGRVLEKYHWKRLNLWKCFLDILYPPFCVGCGADGLWACDECVKGMKFLGEQVCPGCRHDETGGYFCEGCGASEGVYLTGLWASVRYRESAIESRLIHTLKYDFVTEIVPTVCEIMMNSLPKIDVDSSVLGFVPSHSKRQRWRGFNQAQLLAEYIGGSLGIEVVDLLERRSFSKAQMELGRDERAANVKDAFEVKQPGEICSEHADTFHPKLPKRVILIDDVATTLSTLNECARVLRDAAVEEVFGFVFARAV